MANTTNHKVTTKHRLKKKKATIKNQSNLANAKKKTLMDMHELGRLPKALFYRIGL